MTISRKVDWPRVGPGPMAAWLSVALAIGLAGCNEPGEGNSLGDPSPAQATDETPSIVGEGGTLVTDAADAAGSLTVMSVGGPADYVADDSRRAVYLLEGDTDGNQCVDACLRQWAPLFPPTTEPTVSGNLAPVLVGTIDRADGSKQVTYNGHPLYHYVGDTRPGSTLGHERDDEWGEWYLVTPQGNALGEEVGKLD
ncbi:COG4315 family predicted lipoprotein [Lysobacter sp. A286]